MLSGRFGAREGLAPVNEVAVTDPLDHTISTVYDAEDRILAQRDTTYPGSGGTGTPRQAWLNYHDERNMNHKQTEM